MTTDTVLVTGAFGLVGSETVRQLLADGRRVVATDLDVPANRKAAAAAAIGRRAVGRPDRSGRSRRAAARGLAGGDHPPRRDHPAGLLRAAGAGPPRQRRRDRIPAHAAAALPAPPRFVQASSVATYGARNPHRVTDVLTADTPLRPSDIYGAHKVEAEELVRGSGLDWVVLRLGGVLTAEPRFDLDLDTIYFEASLPDRRPHPDRRRA